MQTIKLKVKSSSGTFYQVVFEITDTIKVKCNCKAGIFGKLCKHKTELLLGNNSLLYDLGEKVIFDNLMSIVSRSEYSKISKELISAQKAVDIAKNNEKKIKHKIELVLKEGIPLTFLN